MRNYKKERENYHSRPEQMLRNAARKRARRQMEKEGKAKPGDGKDVHHKDNNPLNNDKDNLSLVTQHYNRKEPRLREKKLKLRKEDAASRAQEIADLRAKHLTSIITGFRPPFSIIEVYTFTSDSLDATNKISIVFAVLFLLII